MGEEGRTRQTKKSNKNRQPLTYEWDTERGKLTGVVVLSAGLVPTFRIFSRLKEDWVDDQATSHRRPEE